MERNVWRKAKASSNNGGCVEVKMTDSEIRVRDTKADGAGPELVFTPLEWAAFLDGAGKGEFDL
jgi:hypothetical protein